MSTFTKTLPVLVGLLSFSFLVPVAAQAAQFDAVYAFGDSLSDNGNLYAASGDTTPPSPPYFNGRFSNGPVWVEQLATSLGVPLLDYAYGGATTGTANIGSTLLPGLLTEIGLFHTSNPVVDPNALYTIWAGANDFLPNSYGIFTPYTDPTTPLENIATAIGDLSALGAKNFMVVNLPDLGELPGTNQLPNAASYITLTNEFNAGLLPAIDNIGLPSDVNVIELDVNSLFKQVINNPAQYGFTNVTDACLNSSTSAVCANPSQYLFWDYLHPTTTADTLIAQAALKTIPESSPTLGLILLGAFGLGSMTVKNYKQKVKIKVGDVDKVK